MRFIPETIIPWTIGTMLMTWWVYDKGSALLLILSPDSRVTLIFCPVLSGHKTGWKGCDNKDENWLAESILGLGLSTYFDYSRDLMTLCIRNIKHLSFRRNKSSNYLGSEPHHYFHAYSSKTTPQLTPLVHIINPKAHFIHHKGSFNLMTFQMTLL